MLMEEKTEQSTGRLRTEMKGHLRVPQAVVIFIAKSISEIKVGNKKGGREVYLGKGEGGKHRWTEGQERRKRNGTKNV